MYPQGGAGNNIFASFLYEKCLLNLVSYISNDFDSYLHVLLPYCSVKAAIVVGSSVKPQCTFTTHLCTFSQFS